MSAATFPRAHTADHFRSIFDSLLRVEGSLFTGESLTDNFRVFREAEVLACCFVACEAHSEFA